MTGHDICSLTKLQNKTHTFRIYIHENYDTDVPSCSLDILVQSIYIQRTSNSFMFNLFSYAFSITAHEICYGCVSQPASQLVSQPAIHSYSHLFTTTYTGNLEPIPLQTQFKASHCTSHTQSHTTDNIETCQPYRLKLFIDYTKCEHLTRLHKSTAWSRRIQPQPILHIQLLLGLKNNR